MMADLDRDIDDELRAHVEAWVARLMAQGMSEPLARKAAHARFAGGVDDARQRLARQARQAARRTRIADYLSQWWGDLRLVGRTLARQPTFTVGVAALFVLGLGVNSAVFRVAWDLLRRAPAGVHQTERLRRVETLITFDGGTPQRATAFSYPDARRLADSGAFETAGLYTTMRRAALPDGAEATVSEVDHQFLPMLGVPLAAGRFFDEVESQPGANQAVAILSAGLWRRLRGTAPPRAEVITASVSLAGRAYQVVGVLADGVGGIDLEPVDVWLPFGVASRGRGFVNGTEIPWYQSDMVRAVRVAGRVATARHDVIAADRLNAVLSTLDGDAGRPVRTVDVRPIVPMGDVAQGARARSLATRLMGAALLVLAIAAANAANLLVANGLQRRQELAVRVSLGAGRGRVARLLMLQSVLLAGAGGACALLVGHGTAIVLWRFLFPDNRGGPEWVDPLTAGVTIGMAVLVGLLTGWAPAWQATRPAVLATLRAAQTIGQRRSTTLRTALVVGQTAVSVTLLVLSGLMITSLVRLAHAPLGFDPRGLVTATAVAAGPPGQSVRSAEIIAAVTRSAPATVATATIAPFGATSVRSIRVPGTTFEPESPFDAARTADVSANYFAVMGMGLIEGRGFDESDTRGADPVVIVNQTMKRNYWGATIPPGACILVGPCARVIGVVEDVREAPDATPPMRYYLPIAQTDRPASVAIMRTPERAVAALVAQLRAATPLGERVDVSVTSDHLARGLRPWRTATTLFVVLGALGLLLAAVGVYSVVNVFAVERRSEFGLRIALGADRQDVFWIVARDGARRLALGAGLGLAAAAMAAQLVQAQLFDVSPLHPLAYVGAVVSMTIAAGCAMWRPAWQAARTSPIDALRPDA